MVNLSNLRFDDRAPVYQQIAEYLKRQILLGTVQDGDPMPSRRALAAQTGINLDKRKLVLDDTIKNVGTYTVKAKLGYEITGQFLAQVVEG